MGKPVKQQRVEPRIAGYDFPGRARCRIPVKNNPYLFARPIKHNPFITVAWNLTILLNFGFDGAQKTTQDV